MAVDRAVTMSEPEIIRSEIMRMAEKDE